MKNKKTKTHLPDGQAESLLYHDVYSLIVYAPRILFQKTRLGTQCVPNSHGRICVR